MRLYNSETDYPIIKAATAAHLADRWNGWLTPAKQALEAAGIEWPKNYNGSNRADALAIEADFQRALKELEADNSAQEWAREQAQG